MAAFNVDNGNVVWETASLNEGSQYVNPLLIEDKGMKVIVTLNPTYIIGVNAADGKILWKFNFGACQLLIGRGGTNYIHTPIYRDGCLFMGNGYGQTSAKIKISFDGKDPVLDMEESGYQSSCRRNGFDW